MGHFAARAVAGIYVPAVFKMIVGRWPFMHQALVEISYWWIIVYVVAALMLLVQELFSITMPFCRRQFVGIVVCLAALSGLYLLYCGQEGVALRLIETVTFVEHQIGALIV